MKFHATELKRISGQMFRHVEKVGYSLIRHRDRGVFVLIHEDFLYKLLGENNPDLVQQIIKELEEEQKEQELMYSIDSRGHQK